MKNWIAIVLLGCFCLNYLGFSLFYLAIQNQIKSNWEEKIWDGKIELSQTETLKIPLSLPYMANQEEFQTTNISMEMEGQFIRVIKQRYQNDSLEVVYLPDMEKEHFHSQVNDWVKDLTSPSDSSDPYQQQLFQKFYPKNFIQNPSLNIDFSANLLAQTIGKLSLRDYSDINTDFPLPPPKQA